MFAPVFCVLLWIFPILQYSGICLGEVLMPYLTLYSPGDPDYTDVIVRRVGDNLTLTCELKGDGVPRIFVWNYVPSDNLTDGESPFKAEPRSASLGSGLTKPNLQVSDSGHYICSAPEWRFSISKFILVQNRSGECAKGALWCNSPNNPLGRCVLAPYVCDGYRDCVRGEDEAPSLCAPNVCSRPDKLNCSSGRCISEAACCRPGTSPAVCKQPACCAEHPRYARLEGWGEPDYPALFEDRHAPDEYGFIQSTIYTVTACALIFMIAVVLLVSAICKMQMKRAALRSYTSRPVHAQLNRQMPRFPPCYEASRLLEERNVPSPLHQSPLASPTRQPPQLTEEWVCNRSEPSESDQNRIGFGLARLSALFATRYRQVSTENPDVELRTVPPTSPGNRPPTFLPYRSPTSCDLNRDFYFSPEVSDCGRDLNYMGSPVRVLRERPRPLTLQLGRFQLSIPRLTRRRSLDRRPDTPNVTELNIEDIDFVRLNSNDTYTLNGRTIRLLGADFENYPSLNDTPRPPPYNESMRYKIFGPPPEYLSRDGLNENRAEREQQARSNIEMPPCYDELSVRANSVGNAAENVGNATEHVGNTTEHTSSAAGHTGINNVVGSIHVGNAADNVGNKAENVGITTEPNSNATEHCSNAAGYTGNGNVVGSIDVCNAAENVGNAAETVANTPKYVGYAAENVDNTAGHIGNTTEHIGNAAVHIVVEAEHIGNATEPVGNAFKPIGNAHIGIGNLAGSISVVNAEENTVNGNTTASTSIVNDNGNDAMGNASDNASIRNENENITIGDTIQNTIIDNACTSNTDKNTIIRNTVGNAGIAGNTIENTDLRNTTANTGICNITENTGEINVITSDTDENTVNNATSGNILGNRIGNTDLNLSNARENDNNIESNNDSVTTITSATESHYGNENNGKSDENTAKNDFNSVIIDLPAIDSDFNANLNENNEICVNNNIEC